MEITSTKKQNYILVGIEGRLDAGSAAEAEKQILALITASDNKFIINLSELRYISSAGLRALLVIAKEIKSKNGSLVICSMIESVKKVFDISGFSSILDLTETVQSAEKKLK